jgi:hypothetical protein
LSVAGRRSRADASEEHLDGERLCNEIISPSVKVAGDVLIHGAPSEQNDGEELGGRAAQLPTANLKVGNAGQQPIQESLSENV